MINLAHNIEKDIEYILVDEHTLKDIVKNIADKVSDHYRNSDKKLVLVGILKGAVVFFADLIKELSIPVEIDFMKVSSYGDSTVSTRKVNILLDINRKDMSDCDILIVEDIIDSGNTLNYLVDYIKSKGANSVRTCTLLDKPSRREVDFNADYVGVEIPDEFVVGYGLDYAEKYRSLPFVGVLKSEIYNL